MSEHIVLLRGVNLGPHNRLSMPALSAVLADAGASEIRTYIQSGNAVCRIPDDKLDSFAAEVAAELQARHNVRTPVVLRTAAELHGTVRLNPYPGEEDQLFVAFLADLPTPEQVASLDPQRSPGDRFTVVGRDVYMHLAQGAAKTKLTNDWMDRRLKTISTARNWRTVLALQAMLFT